MTKGRDNVAEGLGNVVELLRLKRQSGMLSVERMQWIRFEEGEIYFQTGQPIYAHTGRMQGQEALIWMLSWRQVNFTFLTNVAHPSPNIIPVAASIGAPASSHAFFGSARNVAPTSPRLPQVNMRNASNEGEIREIPPVQVPPNSISDTPGLEWLVPQKLGRDQDVLSLPLTRPQRSIYLLVVGRRTVSDLARCTRKSFPEIERLLSELQERGLVAI